ncbi:hypothetical protein [Aquabacterium humicola]|uniref:hypothetical protein n=1 Tax=Aquabacterium humicola TaxID=3237377 RepID=UPI0025436913|nr:hypothetical protein [Rubrivivax pictus]
MHLHILKGCSAGLVAAALAAGAQAAPTVYFGIDNATILPGGSHPVADAAAAAFAAAAGPLATESFEGFATGALPASFTVGTVDVGFTNQATQYTQIATGVGTFSTFATDGTQFIDSLSDNGSTYFTMAFGSALPGFGFYLTDASDWLGTTSPLASLQVHLMHAQGETVLDLLDISPSQVVNGNVAFFGVLADPANPITGFFITNPALNPDEDAIGLDQLMIPQAAVPEPATWALAPVALLALAASTRRRGRRAPAAG